MKIKLIDREEVIDEINDTRTDNITLQIENIKYELQLFENYLGVTKAITNLESGEVNGEDEVVRTIMALSEHSQCTLFEVEINDIIDTSKFDVNDMDIWIHDIEGAIIKE